MPDQRKESTDTPWWVKTPPRSLADLLVHHATATPGRRLMSRWDGSVWVPITAATLWRQVEQLALGLIAAGVGPGDRVALMAKTRYEWSLVDLAIWAAGAVGVPIYESSSAEQLQWVCQDSGAVAIILEHKAHAHLLATVQPELPELRSVFFMDAALPNSATLIDLAASGAEARATGGTAELDARRDALTPQSLATLIYTSGTTGRPKGVELTHGNFLAEVTSAVEFLPELFEDPDASTLLFLPLAHVFGRMLEVAVVLKGVHTGHSDIARITRDLPTFGPTFVLAVPRVFERVYDGARRKAVKSGRVKVFDAAAATAIAYSKAMDSGGPGLVLRARHAVFSRLVYGKITDALGGQAQWAISGGAALGARLGHFFRGIGLTVLEGYGLTETTAACTVNTAGAQRIGSVGRALPGFDVRIAEDGEVLVRGGHVFSAYWHNEEATAEVLRDGWFHTGDIGTLDADGFLSITGRKKEIIVTNGGKNVAPAPLEDIIRSNPLVAQAMVIGDGRNQLAALVTVDEEALAAWLETLGRSSATTAELVDDTALRAEVKSSINEANKTVSSAERIGRFVILPSEWTEASGHLTPSLKVKRNVVQADFADEIELLYAPRT